jgi:hypothetical protein
MLSRTSVKTKRFTFTRRLYKSPLNSLPGMVDRVTFMNVAQIEHVVNLISFQEALNPQPPNDGHGRHSPNLFEQTVSNT